MKKKIPAFISLVIAIMSVFSLSVSAWAPERFFSCEISEADIPSNTSYVELLLPIPKSDKGYVEYNELNGKKFGIAKNSEIVKYSEDGFVSYTFHMSGAQSNPVPFFACHFQVNKENYEANKNLFDSFSENFDLDSNSLARYYNATVEIGSGKEQLLKEIEKLAYVEIYDGVFSHLNTHYNTDYSNTEFDYEYCCQKFKYAKMAYLDKDGNILGVSNAVKLKGSQFTNYHLNLRLKGEEFTSSPQSGPSFWILGIIVYGIPVIILIAVIIIVLIIFKKRKKQP